MATNNLKRILLNEALTQADIARNSGLSSGTINRVTNQKRSVSPTSMRKILKSLNKLTEGRKYKLIDVFPTSGDEDDEEDDGSD